MSIFELLSLILEKKLSTVFKYKIKMESQSNTNAPSAASNNTLQIFKEIVFSRSHWKWYDPDRKISEDLLREIMATAQRAPSSFNTQPYKVVLVRDNEYKLALAEGMIGDSNKKLVLTADTSAVFLADLEVCCMLYNRIYDLV